MPLHPEVQSFAKLLREVEIKLREHNETHWATQIAGCLASVERSDAYGLQRFLSLFGGMGSLNDVLLVADGRLLHEENDRLRALLSRAYDAGRRLERDG
jgi:hypothetical protein